jgi:hypothetical protein
MYDVLNKVNHSLLALSGEGLPPTDERKNKMHSEDLTSKCKGTEIILPINALLHIKGQDGIMGYCYGIFSKICVYYNQ